MRVLLTGGTGYLGEHVVRALRDAGHEILALVRRPEDDPFSGKTGIALLPGEIGRPETWTGALSEVDGVIHSAGTVDSGNRDPERFERINVAGTVEVVRRAAAAGVKRIVVTSSFFALGPTAPGEERDESAADLPPGPLSEVNGYVRSKTAGSRRLRELQREGNPVIVVYPSVLLGPGKRTRGNHLARVLGDLARGRFPGMVGDGDQRWNLVPVADAGRGHVLALERGTPGSVYILGGENWTQRRLVERAAHHLGVKPPLRRLGRTFPLAVASIAEGWSRLSGGDPYLTRGEVLLYDANWAFTSGKARGELGYAPAGVEESLAATAVWIRREIPGGRR